ncbi:MAG TPA: Gfo/Idh/MocA family oxidoreductase [Caulobacteraceae bacterium]|jgi:predicted dehydrogenase|nr:Gfo/Idh/MocA family oxidoreductase [Caulobacteraceae bacterium]
MRTPIRIGLLGASRIAPGAVIGPARNDSRFEVTAVAAQEGARAAAYAGEHQIPHVAGDYAELVRRDDVDLVYNALPPSAHLEWSLAALAAGKHVLCEKPFAMNAAEAESMVAAADHAGRRLVEAFHYRFHRVMRDAVGLVRAGAIGRPLRYEGVFEVTIARRPDELRWERRRGGGGLMDLGCYPLHALRSLLAEEPRVVAASADFEGDVDVSMDARLVFPSGVEARVACSMAPERRAAQLRLEGDEGAIEISNFLAPQLGCRFTLADAHGRTTDQPVDGPSTYDAQLDHVARLLAGEVEQITGGADAVANMAAIDAIYAAAGRPD